MWSSTEPVCECEYTSQCYFYSLLMLPAVISLSIGGTILTNNSVYSVTAIGEGTSALTCHTELTICCREQDNPSGGALGEWIGPDSNKIPESSCTDRLYVTRQQSSISLNGGGNNTVGGRYCCMIARTGGEKTFCVNLQIGELNSYLSVVHITRTSPEPDLLQGIADLHQ